MTTSRRLACVLVLAAAPILGRPAAALAACAPANGNLASIVQSANHDRASVIQSGSASGAGCIVQSGDQAAALIVQIGGAGAANVAEISQGGGSGQAAYVEQNGHGDRASIVQSQANGATSLGAGSLLPPGFLALLSDQAPGARYAAVSAQEGSDNTATIRQRSGADGAYAEIGQSGDANTALITQGALAPPPNGNFASLYQAGAGNVAALTQDGGGNSASLRQNGSNLTGSIDQTGDANTAALAQTGDGLSYAITQDGTSTVAGGITLGGVTSVAVDQTSTGAAIVVH